MIPVQAAAQYLALLGESREMLEKVMILEQELYPYLLDQSEQDDKQEPQ